MEFCTLALAGAHMMEVTGVVIGGVGLLALFETCMTAFEYVETSKKYGIDYQKRVLRLCALEARLAKWGEQVEFVEDATGMANAASSESAGRVKAYLGQIQADFEAARTASQRHALSASTTGSGQEEAGSVKLESLADTWRRLALQRQRRTPVGKKTLWALRDKRRLDSLIGDIRQGIEDLETISAGISPDSRVARSQAARRAAVADAQALVRIAGGPDDDAGRESAIQVLQETAADADPVLSEAVTIAVQQASSGDVYRNIETSGAGSKAAFEDYIATGYAGPAPAERKTTRTVENVVTKDGGRVLIGKQYGGKGVFDD